MPYITPEKADLLRIIDQIAAEHKEIDSRHTATIRSLQTLCTLNTPNANQILLGAMIFAEESLERGPIYTALRTKPYQVGLDDKERVKYLSRYHRYREDQEWETEAKVEKDSMAITAVVRKIESRLAPEITKLKARRPKSEELEQTMGELANEYKKVFEEENKAYEATVRGKFLTIGGFFPYKINKERYHHALMAQFLARDFHVDATLHMKAGLLKKDDPDLIDIYSEVNRYIIRIAILLFYFEQMDFSYSGIYRLTSAPQSSRLYRMYADILHIDHPRRIPPDEKVLYYSNLLHFLNMLSTNDDSLKQLETMGLTDALAFVVTLKDQVKEYLKNGPQKSYGWTLLVLAGNSAIQYMLGTYAASAAAALYASGVGKDVIVKVAIELFKKVYGNVGGELTEGLIRQGIAPIEQTLIITAYNKAMVKIFNLSVDYMLSTAPLRPPLAIYNHLANEIISDGSKETENYDWLVALQELPSVMREHPCRAIQYLTRPSETKEVPPAKRLTA